MIRMIRKLFGPWVYRSSITGKFVSKGYARIHPDTTYRSKS